MIFDILYVLLWITAIMLIVSGIDDLFLDVVYWFNRKKYKNNLPKLSEMRDKEEKSIAIVIGAWNESRVIGRTLTIALNKIRYTNFKVFVGVYPNDSKTIRIAREFAERDPRVIVCLNPRKGPTSKADNLNSVYTHILQYEKENEPFSVIVIHDSEDFIHPLSMKLYNYLIMYKGHQAVQIPVVPIKSRFGKFFHRTYCDSFAEQHTKDLIVRQTLGSYIPFAGTGMAFNRKILKYLESQIGKEKGSKKLNYWGAEEKTRSKTEYETVREEEVFEDGDMEEEMEDDYTYEERNKRESSGAGKFVMITLLFLAVIGFGYYIITSSGYSTGLSEPAGLSTKVSIEKPTSEKEDISKYMLSSMPQVTGNETGLRDDELNVIYLSSNGRYSIQESSWSSMEKAQERMTQISMLTGNANIRISESDAGNSKSFRLIVGDYVSIDQARIDAKKMRQQI